MKMTCTSSTLCHATRYQDLDTPAHRVDMTIIHMTEKRLTSFLLKPFFNLDLLRYILLNHFKMQMEVGPKPNPARFEPPEVGSHFECDGAQEEVDGEMFYDTSDGTRHEKQQQRTAWSMSSRFHTYLPIPPKILTSCLSLFVGEQLASPDDMRMMIDLLSAFGRDLKLMEARLARIEGEERLALDLEHATMVEKEVNAQEHEQAARHLKRKGRLSNTCCVS